MKIIFENHQAPGDIVVMTGAIRDLKKARPDYEIAMDTTAMDIWLLNPHLSWFPRSEADVTVKLGYSDIHNAGRSGRHFSSAFHLEIEKLLNIRLVQSVIWPDLHLSDEEKAVEQNEHGAYWIINAGYKNDYPLKSWGHERYQEVVDLLRGTIKFVQVGEDSPGHTHLPIDGAVNLIGQTSMRDYMRLAYHSQGSLGPVSMHAHVSAAFRKPCVVIAGGREPYRWESYPNQRYLHTNGLLPCCAIDGCWKNKLEWQVTSGSEMPCTNTVGSSARCMTMITPSQVAEEILRYQQGGMCA